jgi:hypothetical protein
MDPDLDPHQNVMDPEHCLCDNFHMSKKCCGSGFVSFWVSRIQIHHFIAGLMVQSSRTCKVSYSLARATGRLWIQALAAILAR